MVKTGDSGIFFDTNPLLYAATPSSRLHSVAITRLKSLSEEFDSMWISSMDPRRPTGFVSKQQSLYFVHAPLLPGRDEG